MLFSTFTWLKYTQYVLDLLLLIFQLKGMKTCMSKYANCNVVIDFFFSVELSVKKVLIAKV